MSTVEKIVGYIINQNFISYLFIFFKGCQGDSGNGLFIKDSSLEDSENQRTVVVGIGKSLLQTLRNFQKFLSSFLWN